MNTIIIFIVQFVLMTGSYGAGVSPLPPPPVEVVEPTLWQIFNVGSDEGLIALLMQEVNSKGSDQVILDLNGKLTISEMEKLYALLIRESYTEALALRLWEFKEQKEKIETVSVCRPRIITIAKSKQAPTEFWIGLSDGSFWQVEPYHMGEDDPFMQKIMINSLLGNCVNKVEADLLEVWHFPKGEFAGLMHVKEMKGGVNFEGKDVYFLGHGGFMK